MKNSDTVEISGDAFRELVGHKDENQKLKAINAELVEALEIALGRLRGIYNYLKTTEDYEAAKQAETALKKARGRDGKYL